MGFWKKVGFLFGQGRSERNIIGHDWTDSDDYGLNGNPPSERYRALLGEDEPVENTRDSALQTREEEAEQKGPSAYEVKRIIDGDTFVFVGQGRFAEEGEDLKVRLIGVDTPESQGSEKLGEEAQNTALTKEQIQLRGKIAAERARQLMEGKKTYLGFDPVNASRGHRGKYGRLLAYVAAVDREQSVWVGEELLREGYGVPFGKEAHGRKERYRALAEKAREESQGLWGIPIGQEREALARMGATVDASSLDEPSSSPSEVPAPGDMGSGKEGHGDYGEAKPSASSSKGSQKGSPDRSHEGERYVAEEDRGMVF